MMLTPRLTECTECVNILSLLEQIDCKISDLSLCEYNKIIYGMNSKCNCEVMSSLLHYKRILTNKYFNCEYLCKYSIATIASAVKILVAGAKCNCTKRKSVFEVYDCYPLAANAIVYDCAPLVATAIIGTTTTTTTTINPLAGIFTVNIGSALNNVINSVSPGFFNILVGNFPVIYGETMIGEVASGGNSITVNYNCPSGIPEILIIKNGIVVGNDSGIPQGTGLNYTYNVSWVDSDDITIALNYA